LNLKFNMIIKYNKLYNILIMDTDELSDILASKLILEEAENILANSTDYTIEHLFELNLVIFAEEEKINNELHQYYKDLINYGFSEEHAKFIIETIGEETRKRLQRGERSLKKRTPSLEYIMNQLSLE
jgi:hypothetical protein